MERLTGQWYLKKGLFGDKIMVEKESTGFRGDPIEGYHYFCERKFVEANQTDLYEIINKNHPKDFNSQMRELCEFQYWLGSNYNNLPTNSIEMTERAFKFMAYLKDQEMKLWEINR